MWEIAILQLKVVDKVDILLRHSTLHHPPTMLGLFNRAAISSPINSDHSQLMSFSFGSISSGKLFVQRCELKPVHSKAVVITPWPFG